MEAMMRDPFPATAWEVEAERRRELIEAGFGRREGERTPEAAAHAASSTTRGGVRPWSVVLLDAWRTAVLATIRSVR